MAEVINARDKHCGAFVMRQKMIHIWELVLLIYH